jgi:Restriction endonuclease
MNSDTPKSEPDDFWKDHKARPLPWQAFEDEVASYIVKILDDGVLGLKKRLTRVTPKRALYSRDRAAEIVFDVVVEVFASTNSEEPVLIWIWECKDYPSRSVTVDEVEEFHSKMKQVSAHKGTVVTRSGFQSGAINFAKSNGIGLMTLNKEKQFAFAMSQDAGFMELDEIVGSYCLYTFGLEIGGPADSTGPMLRTLMEYEMSRLNLP